MGLFKSIGQGIKRVGQGLGVVESEGEKSAKQAALLYDNLQAPELGDLSFGQQGQSAFNSMDSRGQDAQYLALQGLQDTYNNKGLTANDMARQEAIRRNSANAEQAQNAAVLQNAQARGIAGGGLELANRLNSQQAGADRMAQGDLELAGQANSRAQQALMQSAQVGADLQNQNAQKASAQDSINRFNTGQMTAERLHNQGTQQQNFSNDLTVRNAKSGALQNVGAAGDAATGRVAQLAGAAVGAAASGGASSGLSRAGGQTATVSKKRPYSGVVGMDS